MSSFLDSSFLGHVHSPSAEVRKTSNFRGNCKNATRRFHSTAAIHEFSPRQFYLNAVDEVIFESYLLQRGNSARISNIHRVYFHGKLITFAKVGEARSGEQNALNVRSRLLVRRD